jgi:HEPN domain-containing protein
VALDERLLARVDDLIAKADAVVATHKDPPPGVIGFPTLSTAAFTEWQSQSLTFLVNLLGVDHTYTQQFRDRVERGHTGEVRAGQGILRGLREDLDLGLLQDVKALVSADVFSDFLDMADHLLETGYYHPAASLAGAVLENGLRQIAEAHTVKISGGDDLSSLNNKLASKGVYNRLVQKRLQVWVGVRNHADHGEFDEYSEADVREMVRGVREFLAAQI